MTNLQFLGTHVHPSRDDTTILIPWSGQDRVTCGGCEREWCERCDPGPGALCHWCHGRGYSIAPVTHVDMDNHQEVEAWLNSA